jgi:hypothetical protein
MNMEHLFDGWLSRSLFLNSSEKIAECWNTISIIAISFVYLAWAGYLLVGSIFSYFIIR